VGRKEFYLVGKGGLLDRLKEVYLVEEKEVH